MNLVVRKTGPHSESVREGFPAIRWAILLMLFLAITINFLDRQVLSVVAPVVRDKYHFSETDYSCIVICFMFGMGVGQIPVGMLLDRYGARWGLPALIAGWSVVGMLHAFARTIFQFSGLRFLLGLHECGSFSGGVKVIGEWFPPQERALASGLFNSGCLVGSIVAPGIIVWIVTHYGWHAAFLIPGLIGCLWVYPWLKLYWTPSRHPRLAPEVLARMAPPAPLAPAPRGEAPSVRALLLLGPVWGVILVRAFSGPVSQFYWYYLPDYLVHARGMSFASIALFASLPFVLGGLGNIGGGWASSQLVRWGVSPVPARKIIVCLSAFLCVLAAFVPLARTPGGAIALICAATFGVNALSANHMAVMADIFPDAVLARVCGITGVGDAAMSMTVFFCTGYVVDHFSFGPILAAVGLMPILSCLSLLILVPNPPPSDPGSLAPAPAASV